MLCPSTVACDAGSTIADWKLLEGYWLTALMSPEIHVCRFGRVSCPGDDLNQATGQNPYCAPAFVGPLCSECDADHFMSWTGNGRCHACDTEKSHHPTIALGIALVLCCVAIAGTAFSCCNRRADEKMKNEAVSPPDEKVTTRSGTSFYCANSLAAFTKKAEHLYRVGEIKLFNLLLMSQVLSQFVNISDSTGAESAVPQPAASLVRAMAVTNLDVRINWQCVCSIRHSIS